ncbi:MAG: hypothetical protein AAGJ83_03480 [Planctomycetota bacterium]
MHPVRLVSLLIATSLLVWIAGCRCNQVKWFAARDARPSHGLRLDSWSGACRDPNVEELYATAIDQEREGLESCVDAFYQVACLTNRTENQSLGCDRLTEIHQSSLRRMIETAQRFGRFDPCRGFSIHVGQRIHVIPITYHGFVWQSCDFQHLEPVGRYKIDAVSRRYRYPGIGLPLVVTRHGKIERELLPDRSAFAATIRMGSDNSFEMYDPLRVHHVQTRRGLVPLARDLTAPLAFQLRGEQGTIFEDFINAASVEKESRLYAIEPYQPQKTPLILVHGLLSNRFAWSELVNELRASPGFVDHFQIWIFEYPTGRAFLGSAATLRTKLAFARQCLDPCRQDSSLSGMILLGHSMGGLISKLQVTCSRDDLWRSVSARPLAQINATVETLGELSRSFYFRPSPDVSRVIFLGTPHRGSGYARRVIGKVTSSLVSPPEARVQQHLRLIQANPGVFSDEVARRIPTSIDLLDPRSPLLQAMAELPIRCGVQMHSVIGASCLTLRLEASDGIVPVSSARESRAISESVIKTRHGRLKEHPKAIQEIMAILSLHLTEKAALPVEGRRSISSVSDVRHLLSPRVSEGSEQNPVLKHTSGPHRMDLRATQL